MTPFWVGVFENLRGRGRNAALFIVALPALLVATFIAARIPAETYRDYIFPALPGVGAVGLTFLVREIFRARARRRDRLQRQPLSADELNKARRRLVRRDPTILDRPMP